MEEVIVVIFAMTPITAIIAMAIIIYNDRKHEHAYEMEEIKRGIPRRKKGEWVSITYAPNKKPIANKKAK